MKHLTFALTLLASAAVATGHAPQIAAAPLDTAPLDISAITAVAISGDASAVKITTAPDGPYKATVKRHRSGWLAEWTSGWAFDDCGASSRLWIEGTLLRIDVGTAAWFGVSNCRYDINLNVRKETGIAIHQQALQADLAGDFSTVTIAAKAADIDISGHADTVSLQGDALRLRLTFDAATQNEAVSIDARMLEADLDFSRAPALAYSVTAKAALVDSARISTPGAKPSLTIAGELVHATIR